MTAPPWYRKRKYPHFDQPLSVAEALTYVTSPDKVARHNFFPFLAYELRKRRYKAKNSKGVASVKSRPIRIAAHRDGYIFSYYAWLLSRAYDQTIKGTPIDKCVLAYRKGKGSNIEFARKAFSEVERRRDCVAIAMDLKNFFDSIDHAILKQQWCRVLGTLRLPDDHFALFRAMTRYAHVSRDACYGALGIEETERAPRPLCDPMTFRSVIRGGGLIEINRDDYGIPQGSPISAVLSNIYMIPFDQEMAKLAADVGGYYRRYCDDILWIVPLGCGERITKRTEDAVGRHGTHLKVNGEKTVISYFSDGEITSGPVLQYLGFTFDGKVWRIRSQTLSKFWRKVVYGVRAAKKRAAKAARNGGDGRLYKRKIYRRFTHLGKSNFLTYARRAWSGPGGKGVRSQLRRHWERLQEEINRPPR